MEEEQSYHHFLQSLYTEELYIIEEPKNEYSKPVEKEEEPIDPKLNATTVSTSISEKDGDTIVFILKESLSNETSKRFNNLLEKLGLTTENTNIVYLTEYKQLPEIETAIFQLKPDKFVFLGAKNGITSQDLREDFTTSQINNKQILSMPDFSVIVKEKEQVMKCWQVLKEFLEVI